MSLRKISLEELTKKHLNLNQLTMNDLFNISTEFYRHTYDHEVLLSFINDDEAYKFTEWLIEVGTELFREYLAEAST